ncbi:MAG: amidohydrolase family protein [Colwellia sp.]|nr:amidohydrolase family protein [Colwellia sp.]
MKILKFKRNTAQFIITLFIAMSISSCANEKTKDVEQTSTLPKVDILIVNGTVYSGELKLPEKVNVGICQQSICGIYSPNEKIKAHKTIDASGKLVSPGFIDPHTHSLEELSSQNKNHNLNYLTQGVTTVVNGNDGDSPIDIKAMANKLGRNGIGTNVAFYIGHNSVRKEVMGKAARYSTPEELKYMESIVEQAMLDGALGLSTGLYYVPGTYANTDEVVSLAKVASQFGGIYDTHLRDESTFNIGFEAALDEAINVAEQANIHLHLAHIKALGVDVWGQSQLAIDKISQAHHKGISISADQYPWLASGTKLHSAVMPKWAMADSVQAFHQRLNDPLLSEKLQREILDNIRRRGGPESLLITAFKDKNIVGLTLKQIAKLYDKSAVDTAIYLVQQGEVRVASYNMNVEDVERFMKQPWVVTSSDGTNGHPRKYASFPKKFQTYVKGKKLLSVTEFIHQSSGKTAQILGLADRGFIKKGYKADIIIFDQNDFKANANFSKWNEYSSGIEHVIVNGQHVIENGKFSNKLAGEFVHR